MGDCRKRRKVSRPVFYMCLKIHQLSCRYVAELLKMKETFVVPLLHPYATSPIASPTMPEYDDMSRLDTPVESFEHLPIASRFLSPFGFRPDTPTALDQASRREDKDAPNMDSESINSDFEDENDRLGKGFHESRRGGQGNLAAKHNHPHSPYGTSRAGKNTSVPFPSRSHQSLPPPPRPNPNVASTQSLGRQSFVGASPSEKDRDRDRKSTSTNPSAKGMLRKSKKSLTKADLFANGGVAPHQIPDDLRQCLEVIEDSILAGHLKLSEGLRKRYDEQYPLVRSLADVFVANVRLFILDLLLTWPLTHLGYSHISFGVMRTMYYIWNGPLSKPTRQFQRAIQPNVKKIKIRTNGSRSPVSCASSR